MNKAEELRRIADKKNDELRLDSKAISQHNLIYLQLQEEAKRGNYNYILPPGFQRQDTFPKIQEMFKEEGFTMTYDIDYEQWEISWR